MTYLLLMRHAKADRPAGVADFDRPLKKRGIRQAAEAAAHLQAAGIIPEVILSSAALRALDTARRVADELSPKPPLLEDRALYAAEPDRIIQAARDLLDDHRCVMLTGHNPEITEAAFQLAPDYPETSHLSTGTVAIFTLELEPGTRLTAESVKGVAVFSPS